MPNSSDDITRDEARRDKELRITVYWLAVALLAGLLLVTVRSLLLYFSTGLAKQGWSASGASVTNLLWSLACFSAAFLIGFLFGIPKALQGRAPGAGTGGANAAPSASNGAPGVESNAGGYQLRTNTNLEEISDWLTKVLVGATLTQLGKIPTLIAAAAVFIAPGVGGAVPQTIAGAIVVYFSTLGFLTGYVVTRMFFSGAFLRSDNALKPSPGDVTALGKSRVSPENPPNDPATVEAAERVQGVPITDQLTADQALAMAKGALVTRDSERAVKAARMAAAKAPQDPEAQLSYAYALYRASAQSNTVLDQLRKTHEVIDRAQDAETREYIYNSIVYVALYLNPPDGFSAAIEWGHEFLKTEHPRKSSLWTNLACAHGQRYSYLKRQTPDDQGALDQARQQVILMVQGALEVDPGAASRLRELAQPNEIDRDLADVVADTPQLQAVLAP